MLVIELAKVSLEIVVLYLEIKLFKLNNSCNPNPLAIAPI
jgi:hypothetical protein